MRSARSQHKCENCRFRDWTLSTESGAQSPALPPALHATPCGQIQSLVTFKLGARNIGFDSGPNLTTPA